MYIYQLEHHINRSTSSINILGNGAIRPMTALHLISQSALKPPHDQTKWPESNCPPIQYAVAALILSARVILDPARLSRLATMFPSSPSIGILLYSAQSASYYQCQQ